MPLQENLGGEAGKGVLTGGGDFATVCVPMWRRCQRRAEGVVEVVEEEVGEEVLGSAELAVGSMGWGNKRRWLLLVRCSWRRMMAGKTRGPASLAGAAGMLLLLERCDDEALLLSR
jgi:hypothetical protein